MEALVAFFLESTFIGLWIFGWDRLPKLAHLISIWMVAIATNLSAFFILAANSWMQHPVGYELNERTGRAEMTSIFEVLTQTTTLYAFSHTILAAFATAGMVVVAVSAFHLLRGDVDGVFARSMRIALPAALVAALSTSIVGHFNGMLMEDQQPMKMAAAEALCETETGAQFSLLTIGDLSNSCEGVEHILAIPNLTSYLATGDWDSTVTGVDELQAAAVEKYGEGDYAPNLAVTYWSFRLMIGLGVFSAALALAALWLSRRGRFPHQAWFKRLALVAIPMPYLAASIGWIFTEMGRQPWIVAPNPTGVDEIYLLTQFGVSSSVSAGEVLTSMIVFTLIYAVLGVFWYRLMVRYAKLGAPSVEPPNKKDAADAPLSFAY
jgi:cytochrome d ubiquinol oxidase subunit I